MSLKFYYVRNAHGASAYILFICQLLVLLCWQRWHPGRRGTQNTNNSMGKHHLTWVEGLRSVLVGRLSQWTKARAKRSRPVLRPLGRGIGRTVRTISNALWQQTRQVGLNHDYDMIISILPLSCLYSPLRANMVLEARVIVRATPIVASRGAR